MFGSLAVLVAVAVSRITGVIEAETGDQAGWTKGSEVVLCPAAPPP